MMITSYYWQILLAAKTTICLSLLSCTIGISLAFMALSIHLYNEKYTYIINAASTMIRALPDILIILSVNYALLYLSYKYHFKTNAFISGLFSLSLITAAFAYQILLTAYKMINSQQIASAYLLGLNKVQVCWQIIFPQIIKIAMPLLINLILVIIKDSSIVSLIGLNDLMNQAHIAASSTFSPFDYYSFAALIYLLISTGIVIVQKKCTPSHLKQEGAC